MLLNSKLNAQLRFNLAEVLLSTHTTISRKLQITANGKVHDVILARYLDVCKRGAIKEVKKKL